MSTNEAMAIVDRVLEEQALAVGGMAAVHELDDRAVRRLVGSLEATRVRIASWLDEQETETPEDGRHPAVVRFLDKLRGANA